MKSEHRHELKTNELAEWMANFPNWARENVMVLIPTFVVLAGVVVYFFWSQRSTVADEQNRADFSESLAGLLQVKDNIISDPSGSADETLLMAANSLIAIADSSSSDGMAAFALLKRAEALRSLVLLQSDPSPEEITQQIEAARDSYRMAQARAADHKTLMASATYGLGLCAEELGQYDEAAKIYRDLINDSNLSGTAAQASAQYRLKTMDRYRSRIVFNEAPDEVNLPSVSLPFDTMLDNPLDGPPLFDFNAPVEANTPPLGPVLEPTPVGPLPVVETNTTE